MKKKAELELELEAERLHVHALQKQLDDQRDQLLDYERDPDDDWQFKFYALLFSIVVGVVWWLYL